MFRIRESFPDADTVYLWFDGRLSEDVLDTAKELVQRYISEEKKIIINLSNLIHVGWTGKHFFSQISDKVILEDQPEYMKNII